MTNTTQAYTQSQKSIVNSKLLFLLPSSLGDDHFSSHFIKLRPKFPVMKENFDPFHPLQEQYKQGSQQLKRKSDLSRKQAPKLNTL